MCASSYVGSVSSGIRQVQLLEHTVIKSESPKAKASLQKSKDLGSTSYCTHHESGYFENCISSAVDANLLQILLKRDVYWYCLLQSNTERRNYETIYSTDIFVLLLMPSGYVNMVCFP